MVGDEHERTALAREASRPLDAEGPAQQLHERQEKRGSKERADGARRQRARPPG
jgi:hypothetical protein